MKGKRRLLAQLLFRSGVLHGLKRILRERVVILSYHRIRPDEPDFSPSFDERLFGPTAEQFEEQVAWLRRRVRLLSEEQLIEAVRSGRRPRELSVLITTDDGYLDNYTRVFPILRRHGVPAIFFVASGLIESRSLGWWDRLAYVLKRTAKTEITYQGRTFDLVHGRLEAMQSLATRIGDEMHDGPERLLEDLATLCEVDPPSREAQDRELMTWDQLKEVRSHGIAVGSHGHSHAILGRLDPDRQRDELATSRELIARRVGFPVRSVAYPFGGRSHFTPDTKRIAEESGYEVGFSYYSGANRWSTIDRFDVRRTAANHPDRIGIAGSAIIPEILGWP